jgi:hypothetical protein
MMKVEVKNVVYSNIPMLKKTEILKTAIDHADAIIIDARAGLSTAAGLAYDDAAIFNTLFPGYHDRYGLQTTNEAEFYQFPTAEEQYAYWLRHIYAIRYDFPPGKPYLDWKTGSIPRSLLRKIYNT